MFNQYDNSVTLILQIIKLTELSLFFAHSKISKNLIEISSP